MSRHTVILLFALCQYIFACWSQETMPVIAYMGIPNDRTEERFYKDFRDCGFDVSLYGYESLQQLVRACNIAYKHGVTILGHCPETHNSPETAAAVLKNQKGFFGYVLQDEPSMPQIKGLQEEIIRLKKVDNTHYFYINLHPYYAEWTLMHTKSRTYEEYLNAATAKSCKQISFDFYPITKTGLRDNWYANLEIIRRKSLKTGLPFWGFVLSVPHAVYPQPTLGALRLQVYSNLVYGAQAIQYFTYWTPEPYKENDFHNGPVDNNGRKTNTYYLVQKMNKELRTVASLFYGAKVTSVNHLGVIAKGTTRQTTLPTNIKSLKIVSSKGAVISQFEKNGHRYLAIVNKNYTSPMKVLIGTRNGIPRHVNKNLQEDSVLSSYSVEAGDILIFRLT